MIHAALVVWTPYGITGLRLVTGAIVLLAVVVVLRQRFPVTLTHWIWFSAMAIVGNCLPFVLVSWGQQFVATGLAGIIAAVTPLCVLVMAHWFLPDERMTIRQALGFGVGFAGAVMLVGPDALVALTDTGDAPLARLALFGASVAYAAATVMARRMPPSHPVVTSAGVILMAALIMSPTLPGAVTSAPLASPVVAAAVGFLGLFGTGLASVIYYYLVRQVSARFVSLLNYLVPVWAVGLGAVILDERLPTTSFVAFGLILVGIVVTQERARQQA
jgi:drug/metabolite transporter (DMT)-like permease